jgi:hypothetical protein
MKKLIAKCLIASAFICKAQFSPIVNVWQVNQSVCKGDSIKVLFKYAKAEQGSYNNSYFALTSNTNTFVLWQGSVLSFSLLPTEYIGIDVCKVIKFSIPFYANGNVNLTTPTSSTPLIIKNCNVGLTEQYIEIVENPIYFDLQGNRINKKTNELIIEQIGNKRKKVIFLD